MSQATFEHLAQPVLQYSRQDFPKLNSKWSVGEALEDIRKHDIGERLIYFYLVNDFGQLEGIVPTRRLLSSELDVALDEIMQGNVLTLPIDATAEQACKMFATHKFLAFPIVDEQKHLVGVVDIGFFRDEQLSFAKRQEIEDAFQLIGFGLLEINNTSALGAFRYRFPWLLVTTGCGVLCAMISGYYEAILQKMIVLAFFLTLVGGLAESVSMQSMTIVIQRLHVANPTWNSYFRWLRTETISSLYLGLALALLVGAILFAWKEDVIVSCIVGGSILLSTICACILGLTIPTLLHAIHEDSKIAAGPVTLALADISTLLIYLSAASLALK